MAPLLAVIGCASAPHHDVAADSVAINAVGVCPQNQHLKCARIVVEHVGRGRLVVKVFDREKAPPLVHAHRYGFERRPIGFMSEGWTMIGFGDDVELSEFGERVEIASGEAEELVVYWPGDLQTHFPGEVFRLVLFTEGGGSLRSLPFDAWGRPLP